MSLNIELTNLFELLNPWKEARNKLNNTYLIINDSLVFVNHISAEEQTIYYVSLFTAPHEKSLCDHEVKTLKIWLPEAGVYINRETGFVVLTYKTAKRQWLRSYSPTYYNSQFLVEGNKQQFYSPCGSKIETIFKYPRQDIWVSKDKFIYYWALKIGFIKDSETVVCTDNRFKQEIIDWSKKDAYY